jgi:hypothetical protein
VPTEPVSGPADPGQRHAAALVAAVARVLAELDPSLRGSSADSSASGGSAAGGSAAESEHFGLDRSSAAPPGPSALEVLVAAFDLTDFERDLLVLTAAAEIDPRTAARCAARSGDPQRGYPTFGVALAALPDPHWSALAPLAPLRRARLIEVEPGDSLVGSRLRIDERVLHFLMGVPYLAAELRGFVRAAVLPPMLPRAHADVAEQVAGQWRSGPAELTGADRVSRRDLSAAAADRLGLRLFVLRAEELPADPAERETLARVWEREAVLLPAALLIEVSPEVPGGPGAPAEPRVDSFLSLLEVPVVVGADEGGPIPRAGRRFTVPALSKPEQREIWAAALDGVAPVRDGDLHSLVAQFSLSAPVIRNAAEQVRRQLGPAATPPPEQLTELTWQAGREAARVQLDGQGRSIPPLATWADLVLPPAQRAVLREVVAHVRQRGRVYEDWGFGPVLRRGLGVTALFAGGSGTGKTLAAEVIAAELGLDLLVIDLSQVVDKYIGETEKNLRRVFDAADAGGAVLLFDEADALFGKRSEVRDSHDRYANLEVSYLLMRMEAYRGLAVLTTNQRKALDPAFLRRIRFVVEFPFPGPDERAEIWRRVIPVAAPTDGLDHQRLAQLTVTGGSIRNIALAGAFLAADDGEPIRMRHLLAAAATEYVKLERQLTPAEVAGW